MMTIIGALLIIIPVAIMVRSFRVNPDVKPLTGWYRAYRNGHRYSARMQVENNWLVTVMIVRHRYWILDSARSVMIMNDSMLMSESEAQTEYAKMKSEIVRSTMHLYFLHDGDIPYYRVRTLPFESEGIL